VGGEGRDRKVFYFSFPSPTACTPCLLPIPPLALHAYSRSSLSHQNQSALGLGKPVDEAVFIVQVHKISIPTPWMVIGKSRGEGSQKPKFEKKNMKLNWNFQRGRGMGFKSRNHLWGRYQGF